MPAVPRAAPNERPEAPSKRNEEKQLAKRVATPQ
jgi:hypothetical protein